jgi:hypothetical protein
MNVYFIEIHFKWVPVTTAWCVLMLQIEEDLKMEESCEYIASIVADS